MEHPSESNQKSQTKYENQLIEAIGEHPRQTTYRALLQKERGGKEAKRGSLHFGPLLSGKIPLQKAAAEVY